MLLESVLGILGLVGFGRMLFFRCFPVVIAGFVLLVFLFLTALLVRTRFCWALFFLTAIAEALYLFLKGFLSITLLLFFVVNLLGLVAVFMKPAGKAKKEEPKVEIVRDELPKRRGRRKKE